MKKIIGAFILGILAGGLFLNQTNTGRDLSCVKIKKEAQCRGFATYFEPDKTWYWLPSPEGHYNHCIAEKEIKNNQI